MHNNKSKKIAETRNKKQETRNNTDTIYYGNIYGLHDGYDGSVFGINGICKTITASIGGIADILVKAE